MDCGGDNPGLRTLAWASGEPGSIPAACIHSLSSGMLLWPIQAPRKGLCGWWVLGWPWGSQPREGWAAREPGALHPLLCLCSWPAPVVDHRGPGSQAALQALHGVSPSQRQAHVWGGPGAHALGADRCSLPAATVRLQGRGRIQPGARPPRAGDSDVVSCPRRSRAVGVHLGKAVWASSWGEHWWGGGWHGGHWCEGALLLCPRNRGPLKAVVGLHSLDKASPYQQSFSIARSVPHPDYQRKTMENDLMLLKVPGPVAASGWRAVGLGGEEGVSLPRASLFSPASVSPAGAHP